MAVVKLAYQEKRRFVAARVFPDSQVERKAAVQELQSLTADEEPRLHGLHVKHAELSEFDLRTGTVVNEWRHYFLDDVELQFVALVAIGLIEHVGLLILLLE